MLVADGGTALQFTEVHADAAGDESANLDDEYVTFGNAGNETLDLSGWTVSDEANHTYTFPEGAEIAPNGTLTLHTGSSEDAGDYYWGRESAVWNNGGDTVIVRNANGSVVIEREYEG